MKKGVCMLSFFSLFFQEKHERISRENWSRNSITEAAREAKNKLRIAECRNKCGKWRWGRGFRIKLRTFPPFFASSDTHLTFPCNATKKCFFFVPFPRSDSLIARSQVSKTRRNLQFPKKYTLVKGRKT